MKKAMKKEKTKIMQKLQKIGLKTMYIDEKTKDY